MSEKPLSERIRNLQLGEGYTDSDVDALDAFADEAASLESRLAAAENWIRKNAYHPVSCPEYSNTTDRDVCNCGLNTLLRKVSDAG